MFHFNFLILRQLVGLLRWGISQPKGVYLHEQRIEQTYIYALSRIRTHDPSVRANEDNSYLRPRGHCDRRTPLGACISKFIISHALLVFIFTNEKLIKVYTLHYYYYYYIALCWALPSFTISSSHTQSAGLLRWGISPSPTDRTTRTQPHTDIYALSGIRTYDPNVRASEDSLCLRRDGHCDRYIH
jgi:hypothetical protein